MLLLAQGPSVDWTFKSNFARLDIDILFHPSPSRERHWELIIVFARRINPDGQYDLLIRWPERSTPSREDAIDKAEEILTKEWPGFYKLQK